MNELFTIGYSTHSIESFVEILKKYGINAIADVRSKPYSQFKPEFNWEKLKDTLQKKGIVYTFLGDHCGARIEDPNCYINGKADYKLISKNHIFQDGLNRIRKGMHDYHIALMCAEKDPITCHRAILICRELLNDNIQIKHILSDGNLENHSKSERRLMKLFKLDEKDLFKSESAQLEEAYDRQGDKIAYTEESKVSNGL